MKSLFTIFISLVCFGGAAFGQMAATPGMPFGVNLAGAEFGKASTGVYGKNYVYPSAADLDYFASKGLKLVRLPFKWERMQPSLNGALNKEELARLINVISEAGKRDMLVIPDLHNYGRRGVDTQYLVIGQDPLKIEHLSNLWGKLAKALRGMKGLYGYGLMNEPHDMLPTVPWAKMAQACIQEIRLQDAATPIYVGGNSWSSAERWVEESDELKNLYDPSHKLIFEAHVYFDADASGIYRNSYEVEKTNPFTGVARVSPFIKWLAKNNLKGFIGEFGIPGDDPRWLVCMDHFLSYLQQNGVHAAYWAAGPIWGNYKLSAQPKENYKTDAPQMKILQRYLYAFSNSYQ
ncbi:MAG: glycoside hydrolase family 5 protein [Chitinophagaceae bacterium]